MHVMAQRTTAPETPDALFHQHVKAQRQKAGFTLERVLTELHRLYPGYAPKLTTLSRLETTTTEERADDLVLLMLARLYRCKIGDLSPARADPECLSDLLSWASRWIAISPGQLRLSAFAAA